MAEVLLALDAGGSWVKATAFDLTHGQSHTIGRPVALERPRPGWNERDADLLWDAAAACVRELLLTWMDGPPRVLAVGLTGHGNGLYLVDAVGQPTRRSIMASDSRAADAVRGLIAEGADERLRPQAWNGLWAGKPGPLLGWLAAHEPETLQRSRAVLGCKDYLRARLTGAVHTEVSDATAGGLYDNSALLEDPRAVLTAGEMALEVFGITEHRRLLLPTIDATDTFTVCHRAAADTGLPAGTPVVAGVVDNAAMQHGSGVFDSQAVCVGAGTWSINQLLVPVAEMTMAGALGAVRPFAANAALGGHGLLCEASATSASAFAWALQRAVTGGSGRDRAAGVDEFDACLRREAERPQRVDDPMFFPFVDGSRDEAAARGAWLGLSSASSEQDLLGAVIEGICMEHRRHVERLEATLPQPLPIRLSGGATKSPAWSQRFADVLGRPVHRSPVGELGSVCAAAMAGVSAGLFTDVAGAVGVLNPRWDTFTPNPKAADLVAARWERYTRWAELLDQEVWGA